MASDISRKTFKSQKHYSGVLMQQGRVLLDADWNEQLDIEQHRTFTETRDVIGESGVPQKVPDSFKISASTNNLQIESGRIYVGGLLCESEQKTDYFSQPYYPNPDNKYFTTPQSPPTSPPTVGKIIDGTYIVYLDAWQREINHWDDPSILEVALGGVDTTTRLQTVWQIKLLNVNDGNGTCKTPYLEWNSLIKPSDGTLKVQTKTTTNTNPCLLPPSAGYLRLENQLYRIEVQKGGNLGTATFKWSRDNATVETAIEKIAGNKLTVADLGKDEVLNFAVGQWIEIVTEESTFSNPQILRQITNIDVVKREITVDTAPNPSDIKGKLRRWDQGGNKDGLLATQAPAWIDVEDGIQVQFSNGNYRAGDYWLIPARTATGEIEFEPIEQSPIGTIHEFCRLALMKVNGGVITVEDCRKTFPTLTEICAKDICYDNKNCGGSQAKTVQDALDELCKKKEKGGCCTYTVIPEEGWENVFNTIPDGQDAHICFQVGDYPLNKKFEVINKGNLKITGCGLGTKITAPTAEATLVFKQCRSVLMRDLYAETGSVGNIGVETNNLNGTITFLDCQEVHVENVNLKCGSGASRAATCITVRNDHKSIENVTIRDCRLEVGHFQQGILLVNAVRATLENNYLSIYDRSPRLDFNFMLTDKAYRKNLSHSLLSNPRLDDPGKDIGNAGVKFKVNNSTVFINVPSMIKKDVWNKLIKTIQPQKINNSKELLQHIKKTTNRLFVDEDFRNTDTDFKKIYDRFAALNQVNVGSQGITIGGNIAKDIRILNNTIIGFLQGIHVGLSHRAAIVTADFPNLTDSLTISGNKVYIFLPSFVGKMERHGIFVGNCENLIVENNTVHLNRLEESEDIRVEGIKIWGKFGDRLMITKNVVSSLDGNKRRSFNVGIVVHLLNDDSEQSQWAIIWNVVPSKNREGITTNLDSIIVENNK